VQDSQGWDRFYFRLRKYPTAKQRIFKTSGTVSATSGVEIGVLATGQITLTNIDSAGSETTIATVALPIALNRWTKVDLIFRYGNALGGAGVQLFLNGVLAIMKDPLGDTVGLGQAIASPTVDSAPAPAHTTKFRFNTTIGSAPICYLEC
jgi:hypothetical protein